MTGEFDDTHADGGRPAPGSQPLVRPAALRAGDRVAVASPAGPVTPELMELGVETLESWGLEVWLHDSVYDRHAGYLAGPDRQRLAALQEVFDTPEIKAVIFSRGGYGTMRLLPDLSTDRLRESPKLLVGFSDITALHLQVAGTAGVATLHGPVLKSFRLHEDDAHQSLEHLRRALFGQRHAQWAVDGLETVREGRATGRLLGGNLSIVASMLASPHCPDLNESLLLLEDVGEEDYRLDRLFTTLRLSQKARRPAGLVLGDFTGCAGAYVDQQDIRDFVNQLALEFECPVVTGFPAGHGSRNVAVPMGVQATLDAGRGRLIFESDAVSSLKIVLPGDRP